MKTADRIVITLSIFGIAASVYFVGIIDERGMQAEKLRMLEEQVTIQRMSTEKSRVEASTTWIIKHSSKISDSTAQHIAVEVFKYPNSILLLSLIETESEFTPTAVSKMGAVGLGQIMYDIHKKDMTALGIHKKRDLFDMDKNIKATSFILQMTLKKSNNNIEKALHFYLGGRDGKYVNRIFSNYVHLSLEIESALPNL